MYMVGFKLVRNKRIFPFISVYIRLYPFINGYKRIRFCYIGCYNGLDLEVFFGLPKP